MVEQNQVKFKRKVFITGGSLAIIIPPELLDYLQLEDGNEIEMSGYNGKKGKFIAVWKKKGR